MAPFISTQVHNRSTDFKTFFYELAISTGNKQELIAYKVGQAQGVISAYMNPDSERNFPAFQIPALPREMAIAIIQYLVMQLGEPTHKGLNGKIDDELRAIVSSLGKLADDDSNGANLAEIVIDANKIIEQCNRIMQEKQQSIHA